MEWNYLAIIILACLFLLWKLDFIATLLNLKALSPELPAEFRDNFDADRYAKSQAYTRESARFDVISSSFSLVVTVAFWTLGGFGWLDRLVRDIAPGEITAGLLFFALLFLGQFLLHLPFTVYDTFSLEERFGFNKTTPKLFVQDQIRNLLVSLCFGAPLLAGLLWIFLKVPQAWLWAWIFVTVFQLFVTWVYPSWILPLYNKFTPMPQGPLREGIEAMAARCRFPLGGVFEIDGSKRSTKANAYFAGFGKFKKIAIFDTLVAEQSTPEIVAVLAHEIGHFKLRHILKMLAASILQTGALFFLLGQTLRTDSSFTRDLFDAFGVATVSPHAGFVIFAILFSPASRLLGILVNALSRRHEFEADAYAARATGQPEALISALKKLSARNLSNLTPHPFRVFLDHSHPPTLQRIHALRRLDPPPSPQTSH